MLQGLRDHLITLPDFTDEETSPERRSDFPRVAQRATDRTRPEVPVASLLLHTQDTLCGRVTTWLCGPREGGLGRSQKIP